jgi:DNA-binding IclR family transcriptional regulator
LPQIAGKQSEGVQAAVLTLRILEHLVQQGRPVGVTELATALGTTKSRIYRYLQTLRQENFIAQSRDSDRYQIGARLLTLTRPPSESFELLTASHDVLERLRDTLGHSTVISVPERSCVRVLATVAGKSAIEISVRPGSTLSLHGSAQGKLALAFGRAALQATILGSKLSTQTPRTIVDPAILKREIAKVAKQGWAVAPNETVLGANALAAPVFDATGTLVATIAVLDSIQFLEPKPSEKQIRNVVAAARRISNRLGYTEKSR